MIPTRMSSLEMLMSGVVAGSGCGFFSFFFFSFFSVSDGMVVVVSGADESGEDMNRWFEDIFGMFSMMKGVAEDLFANADVCVAGRTKAPVLPMHRLRIARALERRIFIFSGYNERHSKM